MYRTYFDDRRELNPPVGLPRELLETEIESWEHQQLRQQPGVLDLILSDETPIPAPIDREGYYGDRHLEYWLSGLADYQKVFPYIERGPNPRRYLDVGGATGRVARHAATNETIDTWLMDINVNWIDWLNQHMKAPIKSFQNRIFPSLPLDANYFSVISAFSVFTHLDTDELPWLLELKRILQPGGYLYLTVLDENSWSKLKQPGYEWLRDAMSRGNKPEEFAALCEGPMPGERLVWSYSDVESYNINTFLSLSYIRKKWGQFLDVVDVIPDGHNYQTVVVLQKPMAG